MLTLNFGQLLAQLRGLERGILLAALVSIAALFYAGSLGLQWWGDIGRSTELRGQIEQLQAAVSTVLQRGESSSVTIAERQQQLDSALERFRFTTADDIIGLVDDVSRDARVIVASAGTQDAGSRVIGSHIYKVRSASIRVDGQVTRLLDFIDRLSVASPGMTVISSRMGGFGEKPWMTLDVEFLLDPQPTSPTESAN